MGDGRSPAALLRPSSQFRCWNSTDLEGVIPSRFDFPTASRRRARRLRQRPDRENDHGRGIRCPRSRGQPGGSELLACRPPSRALVRRGCLLNPGCKGSPGGALCLCASRRSSGRSVAVLLLLPTRLAFFDLSARRLSFVPQLPVADRALLVASGRSTALARLGHVVTLQRRARVQPPCCRQSSVRRCWIDRASRSASARTRRARAGSSTPQRT